MSKFVQIELGLARQVKCIDFIHTDWLALNLARASGQCNSTLSCCFHSLPIYLCFLQSFLAYARFDPPSQLLLPLQTEIIFLSTQTFTSSGSLILIELTGEHSRSRSLLAPSQTQALCSADFVLIVDPPTRRLGSLSSRGGG